MSIRKRGSVWWIRFTDPHGREIRESAQTTDRRSAQEYHDRRKAELWRSAKLGEAPRYTWPQAVVRWFAEHPDRKSLSSVQTHLRQADSLLGGLWLADITREVLAQYVRDRRASGV